MSLSLSCQDKSLFSKLSDVNLNYYKSDIDKVLDYYSVGNKVKILFNS